MGEKEKAFTQEKNKKQRYQFTDFFTIDNQEYSILFKDHKYQHK